MVTITSEQILGYKRYEASLTQDATNEIVATELSNDTGEEVVYTKVSEGKFIISKPMGATFNPAKTFVVLGSHSNAGPFDQPKAVIRPVFLGDDLWLYLFDSTGEFADTFIQNALIEIRIYP